MQNPHGHIVSTSPDSSDRNVVVEVESVVTCPRCAAGKGCGAGLLGSQKGERRISAIVADDLDVRRGDQVSIVLQPANVLRAAFIVYGYPLFGTVAAAMGANGLAIGDAGAAVAALGGLVSGVVVARAQLKNTQCLRDFTPMVVARLPETAD